MDYDSFCAICTIVCACTITICATIYRVIRKGNNFMTQAEKARAYDEAIKRAKEINSEQKAQPFDVMLKVFPELKEDSEDERIRKDCVKYLNLEYQHCPFNEAKMKIEKCVAWLEKQSNPIPDECVFRPVAGCDIESAAKQAIKQQGVLAKEVVLAFNGAYIPVKGKAQDIIVNEYNSWLEKQGEQNEIFNVPSREVILSIWDLGNEWKELTKGSISTEYGTQLDYIQKHWQESEYYLRAKQVEQKPFDYESANIQNKDFAPPRYSIGDVLCDKSCTTLNKESQPNFKIIDIRNGMYICDKCSFPISQQDEYELVAKRIEQKPYGQRAECLDCQFNYAGEYKGSCAIKKNEQKTAWSEEDEKRLRSCLNILQAKFGTETINTKWLKSLKNRLL